MPAIPGTEAGADTSFSSGILAVIGGMIAIAWLGVTILALVILFAIYAFVAAGEPSSRSWCTRIAGPER